MIKINFEKECYGCGACAEVCPKKCISMQEDEKGFLKACIDHTLCVDCGKCEGVCVATYQNTSRSIQACKALYGYNTNADKRNSGTSGGVFLELAAACFQKGYLIAGCVWDENWKPRHVLTDDWETVFRMQRSKYAQSDLHAVLNPIKAALKAGKQVLFSGTPCQIAAVKKFVGESEQILYVGVVCHGVASRRVWRMYLDSLEQENGKIKNLRMREKINRGEWYRLSVFAEFENGKQVLFSKPQAGQFMQCFQERLYVSERCLNCQYKGESIEADIIIGDGWGQNPVAKSMEDGKGLSCILVLSEKGDELWHEVEHNFYTKDTTADVVTQGNPRLVTPSQPNSRSKKFYREISETKTVNGDVLSRYMYINTPVAKLKRIVRKLIRR